MSYAVEKGDKNLMKFFKILIMNLNPKYSIIPFQIRNRFKVLSLLFMSFI